MLNIMNSNRNIRICMKFIMLLFISAMIGGCEDEQEKYLYADTEEYVDVDIQTLIQDKPEYSMYADLLERYNMDTVFQKGKTLTLFVPTNSAMENIELAYLDTIDLIKYLFIESYINVKAISQPHKVKTLGGKFIELSTGDNSDYINDIEITNAGPLCKNGKYYEINNIAQPKPNLYEYIKATNPFFENYIERQDSSYLDLELSTPLRYNEEGKTVYDSVLTVINLFEEEYFPIKSEFKTKRATMLLFDQMQFNNALSLIADDIGLPSKESIPDQWKNEVLLPYLINQGIFWNELQYQDFLSGRVVNILGDTVNIDPSNIDPESGFSCSNGKVFSYVNFVVPDSVYKGRTRIQGEDLVISKGFDLYSWAPNVNVTGPPVDFEATLAIDKADNDTLLSVNFLENDYDKEFSISFQFENILPGKYRLVWRGKSTPSGRFEIFVNGEKQSIDIGYGAKDYMDLYDLRNPVRSITKQEVFRPDNGFNKFDVLVENITEYGNVEVKIQYKEPGQRSDNGMILDYIDLVSYSE